MASHGQYYLSSVPERGQEGHRSFDYSRYAEKTYRYSTHNPRRGTCLVINNFHFPTLQRVNDRIGSERDVQNVRETFQGLGFDVVVKENRGCKQMLDDVETAARDEINKSSDCFAFVLMTHGMPDGYYCATDGLIKLDVLLEVFKGTACPDSLLGKPKIFIIQGCRGGTADHGVEVCDADPVSRPHYIPLESDKVFVYASSSEHEAYRHTGHGSWFIQVLCGVLRHHSLDTRVSPPQADKEFMWMLQRVCHVMAHEFDDALSPQPLEQMPQIISNLTKELYFPPKSHQQETNNTATGVTHSIQVDSANRQY